MRPVIPNPDNIKRAAAERPERLVRMLPSASAEVKEEIFEALSKAGNLDLALEAGGPALQDAIEYAAAVDSALLAGHALKIGDLEVVERIAFALVEFDEKDKALQVAHRRGTRVWVAADDYGNEVEYTSHNPFRSPKDAATEYVEDASWGEEEYIDVRVWPRYRVGGFTIDDESAERSYSIATGYREDEDDEDDMPSRDDLRCKRLHGPIAIVYQPKLKQLLTVNSGVSKSVDVFFGEDQRAHGYLDPQTMDDCARTHSAGSGVTVGTGDGMALYTGLATLAYQGCGRDCIGSCPASARYGSRTPAGDQWWDRASKRGLAQDAGGGCRYITLETLIQAGLVFWMEEAGDYAGAIASAQEKYAAAFAAAEPDPSVLDLIEDELEQLLADEDFEAWRAAHVDAAEATPNRRGSRRGKRKPAFVTPELEAHVEALYKGLEGL